MEKENKTLGPERSENIDVLYYILSGREVVTVMISEVRNPGATSSLRFFF